MQRFFVVILRTLRFVGAYTRANLLAAMEYRTAFAMQVLTMIANDSLWLFFWWNFFHQFPLTNGWQATDIVILWAVSACGFGLSVGIFGNTENLARLITTGGLDAYLSMPRQVLLHVSIAATDPTAWGDVLFAVGAFLLLVHPSLEQVALFVLLVALVALIFTAFRAILGSLAFFLGNTEGLMQPVFGALISFSTYPMNIFHGVVRLLLFTLLPAGFISFVPLLLLRHYSWLLLLGLIGATSVFVALALGIFTFGLRRYESGNLMGMQA